MRGRRKEARNRRRGFNPAQMYNPQRALGYNDATAPPISARGQEEEEEDFLLSEGEEKKN